MLRVAPLGHPCIMRNILVARRGRGGFRTFPSNLCPRPAHCPHASQFRQQHGALLVAAASTGTAGRSCGLPNQQHAHPPDAHRQPQQNQWRWLDNKLRFRARATQRLWKPRLQQWFELQHWQRQSVHGKHKERDRSEERQQNQLEEGQRWQANTPQRHVPCGPEKVSCRSDMRGLLHTRVHLQGEDYAPDCLCSSPPFGTSTVRSFHKLARKIEQTQSKVSSFLSSLARQAAEPSRSHGDASCRPGLVQLPGVHTPEQLVQLARQTVEDCARFLAAGETIQTTGSLTDEQGRAAVTLPPTDAARQTKVAEPDEEIAATARTGPGRTAAAAADSNCKRMACPPIKMKEALPVGEKAAGKGAAGHLENKQVLEEARLAVQTLDAVSNALCKVADAAELLRQVHPDEKWRTAASEVVLHVQDFMSRTNVNNRVYAQLERLAAATTAPTGDADTLRPTPTAAAAAAGATAGAAASSSSTSSPADQPAGPDTAAAAWPSKMDTVPATTSSRLSAEAASGLDASMRTRGADAVGHTTALSADIFEPGRKLTEAAPDAACSPGVVEGDDVEGKGNDTDAALSVEERIVLRSMRDAMQQQGVFLNSEEKDAYLKLVAEEAALAARILQHMEQQHAFDNAEYTLAVDPKVLVGAGVPPAVVQRALSHQSPRQRRFFFYKGTHTIRRRASGHLIIVPDSALAHEVLKCAADDGLRRDVFELNQQRLQRDTTCEEMMLQLLRLRQQRARYAGYENWSAFAQREGILKTPQAVSAFLSRVSTALQRLRDLYDAALLPGVRKELEVLADLKQNISKQQLRLSRPSAAAVAIFRQSNASSSSASSTPSADKEQRLQLLHPWDVPFFMHQYALLNPHNPGDRELSLAFILSKLQELLSRTMGLQLVRTHPAKGETWHWSVLRFDLLEPVVQRATRLAASRRHNTNRSSTRDITSSCRSISGSVADGSNKHASMLACLRGPILSQSSASADSSSVSESNFDPDAPYHAVTTQAAATSCRGVLYVDLWSRPNKPRLLAQFTLRGSKCFSFACAHGWNLGGPLWLSSVENLSETLLRSSSSAIPSTTGRVYTEDSVGGVGNRDRSGPVHTTNNSHLSSRHDSVRNKSNSTPWSDETSSNSCDWPLLRQVPCTALVCSFSPPVDALGVLANTERVSSAERDVERLLRETRLPLAQARTLLHEFGHAVHSLVSETALQHLSGTRGAVDFSEFPSLLFEHFASPLFVSDADRNRAQGAPAPGNPKDMQPTCSFAHLQAAQMLLHALLDQGFYSYMPDELHLGETATCRLPHVGSGDVTTDSSAAATNAGPAATRVSASTADSPEISCKNNCSQDLQHLHAWLDTHYRKHEWLTEPMEALTSESVCKTLGMPRVGRFEHLVHYGGTYFSYLLCRAMASFVWQRAFAADPFSREAGQRLCAVLRGGSMDCSVRPVLDVAGLSLTTRERLQLLQSPESLPLTPFLQELTAETTTSPSLLVC